MPSGKRETERKVNAPVNTGPSPDSDERVNNPTEGADESARGSGPLQWGPVREMMPSAYRGDYYRPPPAFRPEMDSVEWLERLEDFLCLSRVPPSDRGMAARYLLSDSVRRELYPAGQTRDDSFEEFRRRLLDAYGPEESAGQQIERFHSVHQREEQTVEQYAQEVAEVGRRAGVTERDLVARFAGGITSKEGPAQHTPEMREGHLARRGRPWANEPCKAPHRDRRGPAGEAATPPPSPSPAGGSGPANPGNAARGGN
ncbi:hypothetical protein T03_7536 [Trichinella britovi]|uniref:Retrotransposon gag domain-containing protein n=1 Tax=Trichinella britovi TaxID=45882 RepID=A0A0V1D0N3_TRIBR|nr:hypothetical protein T03_7536 [Trichinella britovi]